ncbi:MAG: DUF401 family protein [Archaeoglobaceae archaeon]
MKTVYLFLSILTVLVLSRRIGIGVALFLGSILLSILLGTPQAFFESLLSLETARILLIVFLAFSLGNGMAEAGLLDRISQTSMRTFGNLSYVFIPLLVGLLPMPGGALISAVMLGKTVSDAEKVTFLNYWYRHIWVPFWPLYPSVVIGLAVVEVSYASYASATVYVALAALLSGLFAVEKFKLEFSRELLSLFRDFYPVLLLILLAAILKLDLVIALLAAITSLLAFHRKAVGGFRKAADWRIMFLVAAVMGYKGVIESSGLAAEFLNDLSFLPPALAAAIFSFTVGFATGIEMSYSSVALPLLVSFTGVGESLVSDNLMLVVAFGFLGVMLSPLHLCLVLTAEHFKADLLRVYRYLLPASLLVSIITIINFMI